MRARRLSGIVVDGIERSVARMKIETLHFRAIERAGATAAKDGKLVAGFIDRAVAIDSFRNGECRAASARRGNKLWRRAWAETGEMRRVIPRGNDLQDAQAVLAVGDESISTPGNHADFDVVHVVELAVGGENLIEFGSVRFFHVDDGEALLPCGDVGVAARDVNVAGVFKWHKRVGEEFGFREIGDVQNS